MILKPWKIDPNLVPHENFHKGYWLNIKEPTPWYYFFRTDRSFEIPSDSRFYSTLDKSLVNTVELLHSLGIPTTPSCAGHFYGADRYVEVYKKLQLNAEKITTKGVILENSETSTKYFYRNASYKLPWDVDSFVDKSLNYQTKGVLGFLDPAMELSDLLLSKYQTRHDQGITLVFETSDNPEEKNLRWKELYEMLASYLLT